MGTRKRTRRQRRSDRPTRAWLALALVVAVAAGAGFLLRPRSLPLPPLAPPRFIPDAAVHGPVVVSEAPVPRADEQPPAAPASPVPLGQPASADPTPLAADTAGRVEVPARERRPRVAIVIDDLGDSVETARTVLALEPPVTVAVIPFRAASTRIAAAAVEHGREVILHLPLEPERADEMGDASGFLRVAMSPGTLERQLDADLAAVPYIVGVNGHMGSRFTQDAVAMEWLLTALRSRGLFFLDSLTSPDSVAAATAARIGIPFAQRSVFLDHETSAGAVGRALARVEALARDGRDVIAIGHPHATTLATLAPWLAHAAAHGIAIVPASALVR